MNQVDRLRSMDARLARAFRGSGLADAGVYTPTVGQPINCTVIIDRDVQTVGQEGAVIGQKTIGTFQLAEVVPARGETITVDDEMWILESEIKLDSSISAWILNPGTN